jgi:hypothetical protein
MFLIQNSNWALAAHLAALGLCRSGRIMLVSVGFSLTLLGASSAQAGLFSPLLQLSRPTVEGRIRQQCEALAGQHLGSVLKVQWQPLCQVGAQKISTCLLEQASRQGKEWALVQEGIKGQPGAVTQSLLLACAGQLLGLEARPDSLGGKGF